MLELILILIALLLFCTYCRKDHPGLKDLQGWSYAHRGLHGNGIPENSMAAFKAALEHGYGIELDIHLLKDGNLAVMHDSLLNRTTGEAGRIEDLTTEQLKDYRLQGTEETIPEFMDVLTLFDGKAPLIVELKPESGNQAALAEAACKMLETYKGVFCLESFDPRCIAWLKKNRPDIIRGQLTENYFRSRNDLPDYLRFLLTHNLTSFLTRPDFLAWHFDHRKDSPITELCRKLWKVQGVTWTLRSKADYDTAVAEGWLPIFEGFEP
ncbi:MAG: glycerophosphodiester phosphodiesterase [Oscillospiraceae bacterium]|nr:glycerophosphodiester phosphodiesterase [Oscillospiraceae bacterium]